MSDEDLTTSLIRKTGYLGITGGIALAAAYLTHPPSAPPETVSSTLWIWVHIGFMISLLSGIFLLIGLLGQYLRDGGRIRGVVGASFAIISLVFVFGLDYAEVFIFPTLAVEFPETVIKYGDGTMMPSVAFAFPLTGLMFLIGFVLFALELKGTATVTPRSAYLMVFGTIVFGAGLSGIFPMIIVQVGSVLYGASLIAVGVDLIRSRQLTEASEA